VPPNAVCGTPKKIPYWGVFQPVSGSQVGGQWGLAVFNHSAKR